MVAEVIERYLAEEANLKHKPGTAKLYAHYLRFLVVPRLGTWKVHTATRTDIGKLHRDLGTIAPITANRVVAADE